MGEACPTPELFLSSTLMLPLPDGHHGLYEGTRTFREFHHALGLLDTDLRRQVGPVVNPKDPSSFSAYNGQFITAGYTGHGMPRAFAW